MNSKQRKWLTWIGGILLANFLISGVIFRWDLTKEKRYSLTDLSKETARDLTYPLEVTAYMDGTYPLVINRFQQRVYATLEELDGYARGRISLTYVDPNEDALARDTLRKYGFTPIAVQVQSSATTRSQKAMYPVLHIRYGERFRWVNVLQNYSIPQRRGDREIVNFDLVKAEANLEYEIVSAIQSLLRDRPPTLAFLTGHGELPWQEIAPDIQQELNSNFLTGELSLKALQGQGIVPEIDAVLIQQPTEPFSERDKYELDQYLMRGGSLFWVLDYQQVDFEMSRKENALTLLYELNLDDFFFRNGLKLNSDLVLDLQCQQQEFTQESPEGIQVESLPWVLYPIIRQLPELPYTRNVESALLRYSGSIDTLPSPQLKKQIFLQSSPQSRKLESTSFLNVPTLLAAPSQPRLFRDGPFTTGVLVEGNFQSLFAGRPLPTDSVPSSLPFTSTGTTGKMALISDGEFLLGESFRGQRRFSPQDNGTLFFNVLEYLMGNESMAQIRAKEVVLRPLNTSKIQQHALSIRIVNIFLPILLLLLIGMGRYVYRRTRANRLRV
ncbi:MAG: Gldg family protein [Bacteroidota bacterium]